MKALYEHVLELKNKLSLDGSGEAYQEDHLVLDRVLDFLEEHLLIKGNREWDWFKFSESDDLEESIKYNIAVICEQRLNGYYDNVFIDLYDKEDWCEYIFNLMQKEWHQNGSIFVDDRISIFIELYGRDKVKELIKLWVENYEDIKPYIKGGE